MYQPSLLLSLQHQRNICDLLNFQQLQIIIRRVLKSHKPYLYSHEIQARNKILEKYTFYFNIFEEFLFEKQQKNILG